MILAILVLLFVLASRPAWSRDKAGQVEATSTLVQKLGSSLTSEAIATPVRKSGELTPNFLAPTSTPFPPSLAGTVFPGLVLRTHPLTPTPTPRWTVTPMPILAGTETRTLAPARLVMAVGRNPDYRLALSQATYFQSREETNLVSVGQARTCAPGCTYDVRRVAMTFDLSGLDRAHVARARLRLSGHILRASGDFEIRAYESPGIEAAWEQPGRLLGGFPSAAYGGLVEIPLAPTELPVRWTLDLGLSTFGTPPAGEDWFTFSADDAALILESQ